jgi:plastocyanin
MPDRRAGRVTAPRRVLLGAALAAISLLLLPAASAVARGPSKSGDSQVLQPASYPNMTTYNCRTDPITVYPGQNLNLYGQTKTCPHAQKVSGPGDTSPFQQGSGAKGFVTRFQPSMQEIHPDGSLTTPSVWDLHLHHVVWLSPSGPTFASGEEKTIAKYPQGYGLKVGGNANWGINYMIHSLNASSGRQVQITWQIDWVPDTPDPGIKPLDVQWMDVAGTPHIYPVFDAVKRNDLDKDGRYTFPDDVPTNPSDPGYDQRQNISSAGKWTVPSGGRTLLFGAGHLHPGGKYIDLDVSRDLNGDGVAGDDPSETKPLFRSRAHYYEPAGAVSWDVALEATRPDWRIHLKAGDVVSIHATYDVSKASWYEAMGIFPLAVTKADDPAAKDPFDDAAAVKQMYDEGGILTHGRLPENIDTPAGKNLHVPNPKKLGSRGKKVGPSGIGIEGFQYTNGGYSVLKGHKTKKGLERPPVVKPGSRVVFTNFDALPSENLNQQAWHTITGCKAPCNKGAGIGYPLAQGPLGDSGELGFGGNPTGIGGAVGVSAGVTTGSNTYETPKLKAGKTYTYFCRIHPFMRGSIRVAKHT